MNFNIRAGMRILYKQNNSNWQIGEIAEGQATVNNDGVYLPIWTKQALEKTGPTYTWEQKEYVKININDIFFDAFKLEDWIKDYPKYFMVKEDYIKFIESDEFDKHLENACVSDGEYGYYPVSKYSRQWLEKQPFDYIIRSN